MNKQLLLLFILLIPFIGFPQIQSGEVIYKVRLSDEELKATEEIKGLSEDAQSFLDKALEKGDRLLPYLEYSLIFNKNESLFKNVKAMEVDNGIDLEYAYRHTQVHGAYYTNLSEGINLRDFAERDSDILLRSQLDSLNWKIEEGEKIIMGYHCKKATAQVHIFTDKKHQITAWFAPDLPFQFGPAETAGLPGLILGLERNKGRLFFYANQINLSEKEKEIKRPNKGKLMDWPERIQLFRQHVEQYKNQF